MKNSSLEDEMAIPGGEPSSNPVNTLDPSNPPNSPKAKQGVMGGKPNLSPVELAAFWALPIAPVSMLAEVLGTSPQAIGKLFPTYRVAGSGLWVRPVEAAHSFRGLKAVEGGAA